MALRQNGYHPWEWYHRSPGIHRTLNALRSDRFCAKEPELFQWICEALLSGGDEYFLLTDFDTYADAHEEAGRQFCDPVVWSRKAILNVARMGRFSSDRTIREYADEIWHITGMR